MPLTGLFLVFMATFAALIVNTAVGRTTQTATQATADTASQVAANTWLAAQETDPHGLPLQSADMGSTGVVGTAVAMASSNGESASLSNYCAVTPVTSSTQYDVIFYDSGGVSCYNSGWKYSVEVQIPPTSIPSTLTTTCNPTYWCIGVIIKQHRLGTTLGGVLGAAPTVTSSSISSIEETRSGGSAAWATVATKNAASGSGNALNSVSCVSSTFCMGVGQYTNGSSVDQTLAEEWGPSGCTTTCAWESVVYPPNQGSLDNRLYSVDCLSTSFCVALGWYDNSGKWQNLVENYNGTSWTIVTAPDEPSSTNNEMYSVTCVTTTDCWMVGTYEIGGGNWQTLTENCSVCSGATPNWSIVPSPSHDPTLTSQLYSVTCVAANDCWAAGLYAELPNYLGVPTDSYCGTTASTSICRTYIEHWDGTDWSVFSTPNQDGLTPYANGLSAVTCLSSTDCQAIGQYFNSSNISVPYAISWNGSAWSAITSMPSQGAVGTQWTWPNSVTCVTASACWMVGQYETVAGCVSSCTFETLIDYYDGTSWSMDSTGSGQNSALDSVTCISPLDCWAVGNGGVGGNSTLAEHYSSSSGGVTGNITLEG
jgi:hypothetical protein